MNIFKPSRPSRILWHRIYKVCRLGGGHRFGKRHYHPDFGKVRQCVCCGVYESQQTLLQRLEQWWTTRRMK